MQLCKLGRAAAGCQGNKAMRLISRHLQAAQAVSPWQPQAEDLRAAGSLMDCATYLIIRDDLACATPVRLGEPGEHTRLAQGWKACWH